MEKSIFSIKRDVEDTLSKLEKMTFSPDGIERGAMRLVEIGEKAAPFVARYLERAKDPLVVEGVLHLIEVTNDYSFAEIPADILFNRSFRNVSPRLKVELLATLRSYGDLPYEPFSLLFEDPEEAYLLWIKRVMEEFEGREFRAISLLEDFLSGGSNKARLVRRIGDVFGVDAVRFLYLLAGSDNADIYPAAIRALGRIKDDSAIVALKKIVKWSWQKEAVSTAEKALRRLSFSGYYTEADMPGGYILDVYKVFISPVSGMGNATLILAAENGKGRVDTIFVTINDETGIVDTYGSKNVQKKEFLTIVEEIGEDIPVAEGDADYFFKLINDALYRNCASKTPLPYEFHYRKDLLEGRLRPGEFSPELDESSIWAAEGNSALLDKSSGLFDREEFRDWVVSSPRIFDYAEKIILLEKGHGSLPALKEKRIVDDFCREVICPVRKQISQRLIMVADFLTRTCGCRNTADIAVATALSLREKSDDCLADIPFFTKMARESISYCREALEEGIDLRDYGDELDWVDE